MSCLEIMSGDAKEVAEFLTQCPTDQLSQDDLLAALINALNRIAALETQPIGGGYGNAGRD